MSDLHCIYIERAECVKCCRCVRECQQKAIYIDLDGARIDVDRCISCGACLSMCKYGAVKLRDDIHLARKIIWENGCTIASLSPQWVTEFDGFTVDKLVEILHLLGFDHVSESALGADSTCSAEAGKAMQGNDITISARCPAVVDYIKKYHPRYAEKLSGIASPMIAHARMAKKWWGEDAKVIYIGGCTAAKFEASLYDDIELAITFRGLRRWIREEGIDYDKITGGSGYRFEPCEAREGMTYPVCGAGGPFEGRGFLSYSRSSMPRISRVLETIPYESPVPVFLDLMACNGGCLGSNGSTVPNVSDLSQIVALQRKQAKRSLSGDGSAIGDLSVDLRAVDYLTELPDNFVSEVDTQAALDELGLSVPAAQIDCDACGYVKCRRFAKALSRGEVPKEMCVQYLRNEVATKISALIDRVASGVAIVNAGMAIEQANRNLAVMLGPEAEFEYDRNPGLRGTPVADVMPFAPWVSAVLENGEDTMVRDIQIKERIITVSIHTVRKNKSVLVICRNMLFSQVRNEEIVARTQKVVRENLETVQKIARLLGENASRTEAILNSILNAQSAGK